jgi:hypothetical protein
MARVIGRYQRQQHSLVRPSSAALPWASLRLGLSADPRLPGLVGSFGPPSASGDDRRPGVAHQARVNASVQCAASGLVDDRRRSSIWMRMLPIPSVPKDQGPRKEIQLGHAKLSLSRRKGNPRGQYHILAGAAWLGSWLLPGCPIIILTHRPGAAQLPWRWTWRARTSATWNIGEDVSACTLPREVQTWVSCCSIRPCPPGLVPRGRNHWPPTFNATYPSRILLSRHHC